MDMDIGQGHDQMYISKKLFCGGMGQFSMHLIKFRKHCLQIVDCGVHNILKLLHGVGQPKRG